MTLIKLTHANQGTPVYIAHALIAGFYHSKGHGCTHVVASGGAVFPAKESCEEVERLVNQTVQGGTNASQQHQSS